MMEHTQISLFRSSLIVLVGHEKVPLAVWSQTFRRLVRTAASFCATSVQAQKLKRTGYAPNLAKQYRHALFYALTTPVNGICWTGTAIGEDTELNALNKDGSYFWNQLRAPYRSSGKNLAPNRKVRGLRIKAASLTCEFQIFQEAIKNLGSTYELQIKIGVPTPPTNEAINRRASSPMIQPAVPWEDSDPSLKVGRQGSFFGYNELHPIKINNSLTVGGTGSGKSQSVVIPLLTSLLSYQLRDGKTAALLVVDPKRELESRVRSVLHERGELDRLVVMGECSAVSLFAKNSPLSMSDRLAKLQAVGPMVHPNGDHAYWENLGMGVLLDMMQLEKEFSENFQGQRLTALMCSELRLQGTTNAGYWQQLRALLAHSRTSRARQQEVDSLLRLMCLQAKIKSRSAQVMQVYTGDDEMMRQWCYAVQSAEPLVNALANPDLKPFVDLDPIPSHHDGYTDIAGLIESGKVIVFCPEPKEGHRIAAMALKQKYFESVFSRQDLRRPIGIVIDEAQKFITNDPETGEQSFLDRCRAYRCIVVMATQSISSLKYALGSNAAAESAIEIVLANTPTKFVMRTTDVDTVMWLKAQLPLSSDGDPHVIDVRRPNSLRPGEAYFLLADGTWGRKRANIVTLSAASSTLKEPQ